MAISLFGKTSEEKFWIWFQKNDAKLFSFEKDQEAIFDALAKEMNKVDRDLTFEFGPVQNGKREFVISAGGIRASFPKVESLHASAPKMERWEFIKFRPRRTDLSDVQFGETTVRAASVKYLLVKDGDPEKVGILLFIKNYQEDAQKTYENAGYLLLDESLGEYDMETKVGMIQFESESSKYYDKARPLPELAKQFDEYFSKK